MPSPGAEQDDVWKLLVRHGLSEQAARAAVQVGARLGARTRRHGVEFAAMLDADSGRRLGRMIRGLVLEIDVRPHLRLSQPDHEYVAIHTHPRPSAFSADDAVTFLSRPQLRAAVVVALGDAWHLLSVLPGQARPNPMVVGQAVLAQVAVLRPSYRERVGAGEITRDEALATLTYHVWTNLAGRFGLRYDRVGL